jgi:glyoxylase-like metal-dependent hydrolase (beta-lactamase superfamily II)
MLVTNEIPVYLLTGETSILFDAGVACLGPAYADALRELVGDQGPDIALLTHSHFDHCGSLGYLKSVFPRMRIGASAGAARVFSRENAVRTIRELSEAARQTMERTWSAALPAVPFDPPAVDMVLEEGGVFHVRPGRTVQVLATPGHTRDFLSFYIPEEQILIPSEAAGIPDHSGYIYCDFLVDYDMYRASLARLAALPVEILCLGHGAVLTGGDAQGFGARALKQCAAFKDMVEGILMEEGGDTARAALRVREWEYDPKPHPKQAEPAYLLNLEARVGVVLRGMEAEGRFGAPETP